MKTRNNKLVALIEMHASANENGQDALCNALYHAINELAKTIGYKGENACDELSSNGELEIDGVCYQFDGQTILTVNTIKTYRIETMTEYETARAKHDEAFKAFDLMRKAYRERQIDHDEFKEAQATYDIATKEFDKAYAIAANN